MKLKSPARSTAITSTVVNGYSGNLTLSGSYDFTSAYAFDFTFNMTFNNFVYASTGDYGINGTCNVTMTETGTAANSFTYTMTEVANLTWNGATVSWNMTIIYTLTGSTYSGSYTGIINGHTYSQTF